MKLFTWKDVERKILLNRKVWEKEIIRIEVYPSEMVVFIKSLKQLEGAKHIISDLFQENYINEDTIQLELGQEELHLIYEEEEESFGGNTINPLFSNVLYQNTAYYQNMVFEDLPGTQVIAFHSYKGGVGRTLALLAFVKAWSAATENKKVLIVDSDIEAPGLTWLWDFDNEIAFSYLDLLEVVQSHSSVDEIVDLVLKKIERMTIKIHTEFMEVEQYFLPTYRYMEQLLDLYASPESIAKSYQRKYMISEVLSELGRRLGVSAVLVDLRAGISEFSAPIIFDPRVKKYIVTSTSYQSVKGTELLLRQMVKGLPICEKTKIPEILLTMVTGTVETVEIESQLSSIYEYEQEEADDSLMDNLVTELPFASELVHLESLNQIIKNLEGREFYKNIQRIVINNYLKTEESTVEVTKRAEVILNIHKIAENQISAEGNVKFHILLTSPINNLIKRFENDVPLAVVMGAKGSGKTFLYREILRSLFWEQFSNSLIGNNYNTQNVLVVPMLAPRNAGEFVNLFASCYENYNQLLGKKELKASFYMDNAEKVRMFLKEEHDVLEWIEFWKRMLRIDPDSSLAQLNTFLESCGKKLLFIVDGLEELLAGTLYSKNERIAISALCQDIMNELRVKYKNIGCLIFLRKDLARNSIEENFEQFHMVYKAYELNWSKTEALRLVLWLANQAVPGFYREKYPIESASEDVIEKNLVRLWGNKLGKANSNEAYSSRWILAALSDFNGQLQARDMIRFLQNATEEMGKNSYDDRYIMPNEIKRAVPKCSLKKIEEVKEEIKELRPVLDKLGNAPAEKKKLPFYRDTFDLTIKEEQLLKQEGYLRIDNEKYYLPEIIRHALKFKYERGARPKVLSLLQK